MFQSHIACSTYPRAEDSSLAEPCMSNSDIRRLYVKYLPERDTRPMDVIGDAPTVLSAGFRRRNMIVESRILCSRKEKGSTVDPRLSHFNKIFCRSASG